jgi:hypothetical protein
MTEQPRIVATASEADAAIMRGALSGAGIQTVISPVGAGRPGIGGWNVYVAAHDVAEAKQVLNSLASGQPATADQTDGGAKGFGVLQRLEMLLGHDRDDDSADDPFGRPRRQVDAPSPRTVS